ncbi:MAG: thioredoxin domain-containing protein [Anaerolineales bacterium]|jgi:protein-disulfide isomerase
MSGKSPSGKKQLIREKRRQARQRQRLVTILIIVAGALFITGLLIAPSIRNRLTPVGNIIPITPQAHPMANGLAMGDSQAPVTIEVFEDFQCPACKNYTETTEPLIIENYVATGKAYYIFRQHPFIGKESFQAADASMCAEEQGRFWDYHDILFANWNGENQGAFSDKRLVAFAEELKLNMSEFNTCFQGNKYQDAINQDLAKGQQYGVTSTPSIFVNGQLVTSGTPGFVPSYQDIENAIKAASSGSGN